MQAVVNVDNCFGHSTQHRPYGELGSVDIVNTCGCCAAVSSDLMMFNPGCGCDKARAEQGNG